MDNGVVCSLPKGSNCTDGLKPRRIPQPSERHVPLRYQHHEPIRIFFSERPSLRHGGCDTGDRLVLHGKFQALTLS